MSNSFVVLMGIGVVFVGLVSIVIITSIMSALCRTTEKKPEADTAAVTSVPVNQVIENKQEIIAAVSAVIAEELGTDISAIRIHSFKKI